MSLKFGRRGLAWHGSQWSRLSSEAATRFSSWNFVDLSLVSVARCCRSRTYWHSKPLTRLAARALLCSRGLDRTVYWKWLARRRRRTGSTWCVSKENKRTFRVPRNLQENLWRFAIKKLRVRFTGTSSPLTTSPKEASEVRGFYKEQFRSHRSSDRAIGDESFELNRDDALQLIGGVVTIRLVSWIQKSIVCTERTERRQNWRIQKPKIRIYNVSSCFFVVTYGDTVIHIGCIFRYADCSTRCAELEGVGHCEEGTEQGDPSIYCISLDAFTKRFQTWSDMLQVKNSLAFGHFVGRNQGSLLSRMDRSAVEGHRLEPGLLGYTQHAWRQSVWELICELKQLRQLRHSPQQTSKMLKTS